MAARQLPVRFVSPPDHGTVSFNAAQGELTYKASAAYIGSDSFQYTVADNVGARSTAATVRISVTSPTTSWHNTTMPRDVNGDGFVSSQDALIIIRDINLNGSTVAAERNLPVGPPYYDVSGDGAISSVDALLIIRELNARSALGPPPSPTALASTAAVTKATITGIEQFFAADVAAALAADELDS